MKNILLLIIFFFATATVQSQVLISLVFGDKLNSDKIEFGLDGGLNKELPDINKMLSERNYINLIKAEIKLINFPG